MSASTIIEIYMTGSIAYILSIRRERTQNARKNRKKSDRLG